MSFQLRSMLYASQCAGLLAMFAAGNPALAGDSRLVVTHRDFAYLEDSQFSDLDYSRDFSAEVWFYLPPHTREGRSGAMIGKGRTSAGSGGWHVGSTGHDYFEDLGHSADSGVYSRDGSAVNQAATRFQGVVGDLYVVSVWQAGSRTLTTYVNGVAKKATQGKIDPAQLKNSGPFMLNGNAVSAGLPASTGGRSGEYYLARLWNRALSAQEVNQLNVHHRTTNQHQLPPGFSRESLLSEWLMTETSNAKGSAGTTHIRDSAGSNHLKLSDGARLERASGILLAAFPADGATGVGPSVRLQASGGRGMFNSPELPIQYSFQVSESPTFNDATLKESGWIAHRSEWQPILKPGTKYHWRVKVRDSSLRPIESSYTEAVAFETREPRNWYVRPRAAAGTYGREDGTSYENAFNGFRPSTQNGPPSESEEAMGVKWGPGGVEAGDTLYLAGRHYVDRHSTTVIGNWSRDGVLYIGASGYSDEHPVIIRMDTPEEPGAVWNFGRRAKAPTAWLGPDSNGVYYADFAGAAPSTPVAADVDKPHAMLMKRAAAASWTGGYGQWFQEGNRLYVKMPDGGHPADRIWEVGYGSSIELQRSRHIQFRNANFVGVSFRDYLGKYTYSPGMAPRAQHIVFDGCSLLAGSGRTAQIELHEGNDYWIVRNSKLHHYKNGVYGLNYPDGGTADHVTIEGNDIRHMGAGTYGYFGGDAHAIGVQNGSHWLIQDNVTEDTGTAIELWGKVTKNPSWFMDNHIIRRNSVRAARKDRATLGTGIAISGENGASEGQRTNIEIYYNTVVDVDGFAIASNNPDPMLIANNTLVHAGRGGVALLMSGEGRVPKGRLYNNLIVNDGKDHIFFNGPRTASPELIIDNNCYYSRTGGGTFYAPITGRVGLRDWRRLGGFDREGVQADPLFKNPAAGDLSLQARSPCVDLGSSRMYSDQILDITKSLVLVDGRPVYGSALDAGAYEQKGQ